MPAALDGGIPLGSVMSEAGDGNCRSLTAVCPAFSIPREAQSRPLLGWLESTGPQPETLAASSAPVNRLHCVNRKVLLLLFFF